MMYNRSSTAESVDGVRLDMTAQKQRPYETIPSTREALKQHVKHTNIAWCVSAVGQQ